MALDKSQLNVKRVPIEKEKSNIDSNLKNLYVLTKKQSETGSSR